MVDETLFVLESRRTPFPRDRSTGPSIILWPVFIAHSSRWLALDQGLLCQARKK